MTSLHVICGLGPPNQKSWLRLCGEPGEPSFSIDSLWFPARRCDISGILVVPLVVFVVLDRHLFEKNVTSNKFSDLGIPYLVFKTKL